MAGSVLLVEDEENLASLVAAYLEQEGYRVVAVGTGADALQAVEQQPVRLVVLDLNLPDMDGLDVCKPFSPRELVARMKAVLRRAEPHAEEQVLVLGDVVLQRNAREVAVDSEQVELRPKEFDLLAYLMQNRGVVVSRELLLERVWGFDYAGG